MPISETLSTCRRKALLAFGFGLACLALAWAAQAGHWPIDDSHRGLLAGIGAGAVFSAGLLWFSPDQAAPPALLRRYRRELLPAMAVYIGVMLFWKPLLAQVQAAWLRLLVALLPALAVVWIMRIFVRFVRDSDELQRRIELESSAFAALLVSAGYMAAGFVQTAGLIDLAASVAMLGVFPSLCLGYGIAKVYIARRYR